ncbi:hypothetical protein GF402_06200 [Candidatus Fermentibacteria bacterium]|nr:hypothetical protein [Candidatus Fermentibacteria bacterium]
MKSRIHRLFWTEVGRRVLQDDPGADSDAFPPPMAAALRNAHHPPPQRIVKLGTSLRPRKTRYLYGLCWNVLRGMGGFKRPLRLRPFPGVTLMVPFGAPGLGVLPQSLSKRIPRTNRAYALVGKGSAAAGVGTTLLVVLGVRSSEVENLLERGSVSVCTLDTLRQAVDCIESGSGARQPTR